MIYCARSIYTSQYANIWRSTQLVKKQIRIVRAYRTIISRSVFVSKNPALVWKAASLIEKETEELRTSNIERPTSNKVFYLFNNKAEQANLTEVATKVYSESILYNFTVLMSLN